MDALKYVEEIWRGFQKVDLSGIDLDWQIATSAKYGCDTNAERGVEVYGTIKSETGLTVPIRNIRISFLNIDNSGISDDSGKFTVYVPYQKSYIVNFTDPSGKYASKTIKTKYRDLETVTLAEKGGE
jgi:hypothetical protein